MSLQGLLGTRKFIEAGAVYGSFVFIPWMHCDIENTASYIILNKYLQVKYEMFEVVIGPII